jgi:hypothetical protein
MKLALLTLLAITLSGCLSHARDVTFEWDLNPEPDIVQYRLETATSLTGPWVRAGETLAATSMEMPTTLAFLQVKGLPNATFFVRAYAKNLAGLESDPSDPLTVDPDRPGKPGKPRIKVVLQSSTDLKTWGDFYVMEKEVPEGSRQFFRTALNVLPGS